MLRALKSLPSLILVLLTSTNVWKSVLLIGTQSQHPLAAGVPQFDLPERVAPLFEREDSGDRHFQLTARDEVGQLGDHRRRRGICTARRQDPELLHGSEIGDGVDPV